MHKFNLVDVASGYAVINATVTLIFLIIIISLTSYDFELLKSLFLFISDIQTSYQFSSFIFSKCIHKTTFFEQLITLF